MLSLLTPVVTQVVTNASPYWDTFKVIATLFGFITGVAGFVTLGSKVFRFMNSLTDFITEVAPKVTTSVGNMESLLEKAVFNHLEHIQASSEATLIAIEHLGGDMEQVKNSLHAQEIKAAKVQGTLSGCPLFHSKED